MNRDALPPPEDDQGWDEAIKALLPFFVNGSLDPAGRRLVERWVERSDVNAAELRWHASLAASVQEDAGAARADAGLAHLRARIRAERVAEAPQRSAPSVLQQLSLWWQGLAPLAPRFAYAAVVVQAAALGVVILQMSKEHEVVRGGAVVAPMAPGPYARVLFHAQSDEQALRQFLIAQRLQIVAGPNPIGEYWLARMPPGDPNEAGWIDAVRRAPVVVEAVADDRPPSARD